MDNGESTPKMDGESSKTKKQGTNTQDLGKKIRGMGTEENKLWYRYMKGTL